MREWLQTGLRLGLGAVFVYAGFLKVVDPVSFADSVASFRMLPAVLISPVALALPVYELLVGLLLLVKRWTAPAAAGVLLLCAVFAVALVNALARGLVIDCGCFGKGTWSGNAGFLLTRDLVLAGVAYVILRRALAASAHTQKDG